MVCIEQNSLQLTMYMRKDSVRRLMLPFPLLLFGFRAASVNFAEMNNGNHGMEGGWLVITSSICGRGGSSIPYFVVKTRQTWADDRLAARRSIVKASSQTDTIRERWIARAFALMILSQQHNGRC